MQNISTALTIKIDVDRKSMGLFADWQAKLNTVIALFPGFISLEIVSTENSKWMIVQRFASKKHLMAWRSSSEWSSLLNELHTIAGNTPLQESESSINQNEGATEVIVTNVDEKNYAEFRNWMAKIHNVEAKFPGFRGVYVQSPTSPEKRHWITMLQFDTLEHLNQWIDSPERLALINEAQPIITSLQNHRVIPSYSGWFSSIAKDGSLPPTWKQTMLVLLVLFPIVMLELKFLSPLTSDFNLAIATFISNALSVSLIAWPFMPVAIQLLRWWLSPTGNTLVKTIIGTLLVIILYLIEILVFIPIVL